MPQLSIGLALAGGGARGIAHIGILQVLQRNDIQLSRLTGTSAGAIIAAMYAAQPDAQWVETRFREFLQSPAFRGLGTERLARQHDNPEAATPFGRRLQNHVVVNLSLMRQFMIPREKLNQAIEFLVPARRFADLELPLTVCAADLQSGKPQLYSDGDLIRALANSASIPGILEPEISSEHIVVDGGVLMPVPVPPLLDQVDFIIASEVSLRGLPPMTRINIFELMMRSEQFTQMTLAQHQAWLADFAFCPDTATVHWSQFNELDTLLANGLREAEDRIAALKKLLRRASSPLGTARRWLRQRLIRRYAPELRGADPPDPRSHY